MLISVEDILVKLPVSRPMIYALIARHDFPKPLKIGARSLWDEAEVQAWIDTKYAERDNAK